MKKIQTTILQVREATKSLKEILKQARRDVEKRHNTLIAGINFCLAVG
jgi:hypothetical protein